MDNEKKFLKINLSTIILLVIIFILILAIIGLILHYNKSSDKSTSTKKHNNTTIENSVDTTVNNIVNDSITDSITDNIDNNIDDNINNSTDNNIDDNVNSNIDNTIDNNITNTTPQLSLAPYIVNMDGDMLNQFQELSDSYIEFLADNKFSLYYYGSVINGTYTISDETIINCICQNVQDNYINQKIDATITFKVIDNSTITVINSSKTYRIETWDYDYDNNEVVLSGKYKDMSLFPFTKGISFVKFNKNLIDL